MRPGKASNCHDTNRHPKRVLSQSIFDQPTKGKTRPVNASWNWPIQRYMQNPKPCASDPVWTKRVTIRFGNGEGWGGPGSGSVRSRLGREELKEESALLLASDLPESGQQKMSVQDTSLAKEWTGCDIFGRQRYTYVRMCSVKCMYPKAHLAQCSPAGLGGSTAGCIFHSPTRPGQCGEHSNIICAGHQGTLDLRRA